MIRNFDYTKLIAGSLIRMNKKAKLAFFVAVVLLVAVSGLIFSREIPRIVASAQGNSIVVVSAASFDSTLAPESIAAVFGVDLATDLRVVNTLPLPTELLGTSVAVRDSAGTERLAFLFFISPGQINCLIPAGTAEGVAIITVRSGKGNTETGTAMISKAAPAILTANASGVGAPAAVALRIRSNGSFEFEGILQGAFPTLAPAAIDLGPEGERVFLVLYLCGLRFVPKADVRVLLGGSEIPSEAFAYSPSDFIGVDQLNVELSRSLIGRGRLKLSVSAQGRVSNQIEIEIGGRIVSEAPQITAVSKTADVLAGEEIVLTGARFAANAKDNTVRFGTRPATVVSANSGQLRIRVPYGAESDQVTVITPQGEGRSSQTLTMRTTISGFVKDTHNAPIPGVKVTMGSNNRTVLTNSEGLFFMSEVPANTRTAFLQFDGREVTGALFPDPPIKYSISSNRDNLIETPVFLLQVNGAQTQVGSALTGSPETDEEITLMTAAPDQTGVGDLKFIVPAGTTIRFPNGATSGTLTLNAEPNGLTPVALPPDNFVSVIAQIAFFGATLTPGGRLIFPNPENLPPGTPAKLYRYDVNSADNSPWVDTKDAVTVFADRIETSVNAVKQTSYYFVAAERPVTTAIGRVVEDNGTPEGRPVAGATVRIRGRETLTDGNGGFVLRNVGVNGDGRIFADVNLLRANGQVDSKQSANVSATLNGLTNLGTIILSSDAVPNRPPVALIPATITVNAGEQFDQPFTASDPDPGQSVSLQISDTRLAEIISRGNSAYTLRLKPALSDANTIIKLTLTVIDNLGKSQSFDIAVIVRGSLQATPQSVTINEDQPVSIRLSGSDPAGRPLTYQIVSQPGRGRLTGTSPNLTYTPEANYNGSDSFTFKVNNGVADSNVATIIITINPVNDAPVLTVPGTQTVTAGQPLSFAVTASDVDIGQTLTLSASNLPGGATFTQTSATRGQFNWTPSAAQAGNYTITFRVSDNGTPSLSDSKTISVTVQSPLLRWSQTNGPTGGQINALAINGTTLFAGTSGSGVFISTNNGQSWTPVNNGLTPLYSRFVSALAISTTNLFAGTGVGIFVSSNNGQNWTVANNGLTSLNIRTLATLGTSIFAGTDTGVFVSTNNGQNWALVNNGLTASNVNELAVIGLDIFAGTHGGGIFVSSNNGQNWRAINNGLTNQYVYSLAAKGTSIFAGTSNGIFVSINNGQNWESVNNGLSGLPVQDLAINDTSIFAGTNGGFTAISGGSGVFVSTNNGQSWNPMNNGLTSLAILSLAISGINIFAGTSAGIFVSINNGQSWAPANVGINGFDVPALAVSSTNILAASFGGGVFTSANNGQSWLSINNGLTNLYADQLLVQGTTIFLGTIGGGVFVSSDNGQNWAAANIGLTTPYVECLAANGSTIYAGTGGSGVFMSTNNGKSWSPINNGLPVFTVVYELLVNGSNIFAGTGEGFFASSDNGQTWVRANNGLPNSYVGNLTLSNNNIFAGTAFGMFVSNNNGQSWTRITGGLPSSFVSALAINGGSIFAGTASGVFVSGDNGQTWSILNDGLQNNIVKSFAFKGTKIFAGTFGDSVFMLDLAGNP